MSFDQAAGLLAVTLATWAALDFLHAERGAPLALDGLYGWACYLLLGLAGCALTARAQGREADTRALLVPALAAAPFVLALMWLLPDAAIVERHPLLALVAGLVYLCVLALRTLSAAFGGVRRVAAIIACALVVLAPWVLGALDLDTRLWVAEEPGSTESTQPDEEAEALFYEQPARIAAAVARVKPAQPGKPGVYFVGFAGDGEQSIFGREARLAAEAFGARYGSRDRSVLLINDADDRDSTPLASLTGLTQTLRILASRMNTQDDVLVLFLTSHGTEDALDVENGGLPLKQMEPGDLREALDAAGIRWRVIVVSACYAGIFLDELKNETTAIITAADATHTSFGCEDDRELTWFGEAFLKDSLPGSASLEDAFRKAAGLIAKREDAGHEAHSNPQLYIGELMRGKLASLPTGATTPAYTVRQ